MSQELTISIAASFSKSNVLVDTSDMNMTGLQFTVNGEDCIKATQLIGTTAEAIGKGEITTPGYFFVKNLDATNYVEIDKATFTTGSGTIKLKPGEIAAFRTSSTAPYACANTASCRIFYMWIED